MRQTRPGQDFNFPVALNDPQGVEQGGKVVDFRLRARAAQLLSKQFLAGQLARPGVGSYAPLGVQQRIAAHLPAFGRAVRRKKQPRPGEVVRQSDVMQHRVHARQFGNQAGVIRTQGRPFAPLVLRIAPGEIQRGLRAGAVDQQIRMRHFQATQIIELIGLTKDVESTRRAGPLHNGQRRVANRLADLCTPFDKLRRREVGLEIGLRA